MKSTSSVKRKPKQQIGRLESVSFLRHGAQDVPSRIDTGAQTSSVWASSIQEKNGILHFVLFDKGSPFYDGVVHKTDQFEITEVTSTIGNSQERYKVRLLVKMKNRRIYSRFTLADRSKQTYPVLIGRNTLRGKFIVDVSEAKL